MTPSAAYAATSACLASAATGAQYDRHSPRRRSAVRLLLNRCGVSLSALVERDHELRPNSVAPRGVKRRRARRPRDPQWTTVISVAGPALLMQMAGGGLLNLSPGYGEDGVRAGERVVAIAMARRDTTGRQKRSRDTGSRTLEIG
jgi:hypothetical protein